MDATKEDGSMGRLINHSRNKANLKSLNIEVDEILHIIFTSLRDILPEELLYDYGDRDVKSVNTNPWLKH